MEGIARESMLFDCYGSLLTEKKRSVMKMYYDENLSLSEIAEQEGISRSAVHDSLKSARRKLEEYESHLHILDKTLRTEAAERSVEVLIGKLHEGELPEQDLLDALCCIRKQIEDTYGL